MRRILFILLFVASALAAAVLVHAFTGGKSSSYPPAKPAGQATVLWGASDHLIWITDFKKSEELLISDAHAGQMHRLVRLSANTTIMSITASPDGGWIAFTIANWQAKNWRASLRLCLIPTDGSAGLNPPCAIPAGNVLSFSPNSEWLAYIDVNGRLFFYKTGARPALEAGQAIVAALPSNGSHYSFSALDPASPVVWSADSDGVYYGARLEQRSKNALFWSGVDGTLRQLTRLENRLFKTYPPFVVGRLQNGQLLLWSFTSVRNYLFDPGNRRLVTIKTLLPLALWSNRPGFTTFSADGRRMAVLDRHAWHICPTNSLAQLTWEKCETLPVAAGGPFAPNFGSLLNDDGHLVIELRRNQTKGLISLFNLDTGSRTTLYTWKLSP